MIEIYFPSQWSWFQMLHWLTDRVKWCDGQLKNMRTNPVWVTSIWSFDV